MSESVVSSADALTGLPGYEACVQTMAREVQGEEGGATCVTLALFDLDWFARVNKEHGSEIGDAALRVLARHLTSVFSGTGQVFRFGGDALMVLLPTVSKEQGFLLAEEARKGFDRSHTVSDGGKKVNVTLSISVGVAAFPDDGTRDGDVMRKANEAVYRAKVSGRNKVCLAREEKMVTKTSHFTQGQLEGLSRLAKREGLNESVLLREAVDDLLRKYNR